MWLVVILIAAAALRTEADTVQGTSDSCVDELNLESDPAKQFAWNTLLYAGYTEESLAKLKLTDPLDAKEIDCLLLNLEER